MTESVACTGRARFAIDSLARALGVLAVRTVDHLDELPYF